VATPSVSAGGYVQLSSQRSEEAALSAFRALQKKFPAILGSLAPDVQKADLGTKGVYYRVRVGQPSRDAAAALCEQLRGAGGDCLLAR
jgi:primosomal protein N'